MIIKLYLIHTLFLTPKGIVLSSTAIVVTFTPRFSISQKSGIKEATFREVASFFIAQKNFRPKFYSYKYMVLLREENNVNPYENIYIRNQKKIISAKNFSR